MKAEGCSPIAVAHALVDRKYPGVSDDATKQRLTKRTSCKNWAMGAFGLNNDKVVQWLKAQPTAQDKTDAQAVAKVQVHHCPIHLPLLCLVVFCSH